MFPSVRLAQNILETGCVIHPWYNLGGIKVGSGETNEWWDGSSVVKNTWEVIDGYRVDTAANFRAYKSVYHFYKDQDLFFQASRYDRVRSAISPDEQARMLKECGYATDPQYADKLISIIDASDLRKYDDVEGDNVNLSDNEWNMVAVTLKNLYDDGIISDSSWIDKAENKELTLSELSFLNLIIVSRK